MCSFKYYGNIIGSVCYLYVFFAFVILILTPESCSQQERRSIPIGGLFQNDKFEIEEVFKHKLSQLNNDDESDYYFYPYIHQIHFLDPFKAGKLACNLTATGVAAIIGPQHLECSQIVDSICHNLKVPHLQTHWERSPLDPEVAKMTINMYPDNNVLSLAFADIVKVLEWKSFTVIYDEEAALIRLQEVFRAHKSLDTTITVRQIDGHDHRSLLKDIQASGERNILLDVATDKIMEVLNQASEIKMTDEYMNYFITNLDTHTVDFDITKFSLTNITAVSLINPGDFNVHQAVRSWQKEIPDFQMDERKVPTELGLTYDALDVFYRGVRRAKLNHVKKVHCDAENNRWRKGEDLYEYLKKVQIDGVTGPIQFNEMGRRRFFTLQILEFNQEGFKQFGTWDPENKMINYRSLNDTLAQYEATLRYKTLRVVSRIGPPHLMWKNESAQGNDRWQGYAMDLINEISKLIGFKYEFYLAPDEKYGNYDPVTKKWNGLIKELLDRNADLGICDLTITYERRSVVDFTMPFMTLGISILYRKQVPTPPSLFSFMQPLSLEVWLYMAVAFLAVTFFQYVITKMCPKDWENPTPTNPNPTELENVWDLKNCVWLALGAVMCQGCDILPKGSSSRAATGFWWFFALIVIQSYIANLTAFLTTGRIDDQISSAEDLAKQTKVKYGTIAGGSTAKFFQESNYSTYQRMWSMMESTRPSVFVSSNPEGVDRVLNGKGTYAFLMESSTLEYMVERNCELTQIGGQLDSKGYGIAMPVNSPYRTQISGAVLKLQEKGKLQELKNKWWKVPQDDSKCNQETTNEEAQNEMGIENVGGIFVVLIFGCTISFFIALLEFLWNIRTVAVEHKISPWDALKSEWNFFVQVYNKEKPAKPYKSETSSEDRSVALSMLRDASSFLRLNKLVDKKEN